MKLLFSISILLFSYSVLGQSKIIFVYFDVDSYQLNDAELLKLEPLLKLDSEFVEIFQIDSYTDYTGTKEYNKELSKRRSKSVIHLLNAFAPPQKVYDFGEEYATSNYTPQKGRRVEISYNYNENGQSVVISPFKKEPITSPIETVSEGLVNDFSEFLQDSSADTTTIVLSILFYGGSSRFINSDDPDLWAFFDILRYNESLSVEIRGHVCCGSAQLLSTNRAYAVYQFMARRGISPNRMKYKGYDNSIPAVFPEVTAIDRSKNRRVDVVFHKQ